MSRHDPRVRLSHMRDFARKALAAITGKTKADLEHDEILQYAVVHLVELIGEAASQVPEEVRIASPAIPWTKVVSMRNRLIHGYDFVDLDILWETLQADIPPLLAELERLLGEGS